jgi:hypothetical protein
MSREEVATAMACMFGQPPFPSDDMIFRGVPTWKNLSKNIRGEFPSSW